MGGIDSVQKMNKMERYYTENMVQKVERYLGGRMTEAECHAFEQEAAEDKNLQQLIEHHRMLIDAVQLASYKEDKASWQALQQAILEEEANTSYNASENAKPSLFKKNGWLIIMFVTGILIGALGISTYNALKMPLSSSKAEKKLPIANNENEEEIPLGYVGDKIVRSISHKVLLLQNNKWKLASETTRQVLLQVEKQPFTTYVLNKESLSIYLPEAAIKTVVNADLQWVTSIKIDTFHYLRVADHWFELIPSSDRKWLGSLSEKNVPGTQK